MYCTSNECIFGSSPALRAVPFLTLWADHNRHYFICKKKEETFKLLPLLTMFHYDFFANLSDRSFYLLYCNTCINNKIFSFFHTLHVCVSFNIRIKSGYLPEYQQAVIEIDGLCLLQCCAMTL